MSETKTSSEKPKPEQELTPKELRKLQSGRFTLYRGKIVAAAGVIFYKIVDGQLFLLLQHGPEKPSKKKPELKTIYTDFGGRVDPVDANAEKTVERECREESNGKLTFIRSDDPLYHRDSKYLLFLEKATEEEEKLDTDDFGPEEEKDGIKRDVKWITLSEFQQAYKDRLLHPRLMSLYWKITKKLK